MPLMLVVIAALVGAMISAQLSGRFVESRETSAKLEMRLAQMDAVRELGTVVRTAYGFAQAGSGACPTGTKLIHSDDEKAVALCWPTKDKGCLLTNNWYVCRKAGAVTQQGPPWSLIGVAQAAASTVTVTMPVCAGPASATKCASCADVGSTTCLSMQFCVNQVKQLWNCSDPVVQTYAIREY